jgi:hypothetical protein
MSVYGGDPFAYDFKKALAAAKVTEAPKPLPFGYTYMNRVPAKDEFGETVGMLGDPDPAKLARHVKLYGQEGAEPWLQQETPSAIQSVVSRTSRRSLKSRSTRRPQKQSLRVKSS